MIHSQKTSLEHTWLSFIRAPTQLLCNQYYLVSYMEPLFHMARSPSTHEISFTIDYDRSGTLLLTASLSGNILAHYALAAAEYSVPDRLGDCSPHYAIRFSAITCTRSSMEQPNRIPGL